MIILLRHENVEEVNFFSKLALNNSSRSANLYGKFHLYCLMKLCSKGKIRQLITKIKFIFELRIKLISYLIIRENLIYSNNS